MNYQEILNFLFTLLLVVACIAGVGAVIAYSATGLSALTLRMAAITSGTGVGALLLARRNIRREKSDEE